MPVFSVSINNKTLFTFLSFICLALNNLYSQEIYTGKYGKYKHQYTMQLNTDSSVVLIKTINQRSYSDYTGNINRINDTLYSITIHNSFHQCVCRAVGDSLLYVTIDSTMQNTIKEITIVYSNNQQHMYPVTGREMEIPIHKKLDHSISGKKFFYVSAKHINPLTHQEVKTRYEPGTEYCLELFKNQNITFNVMIKNNRIRKIGKGEIPNFILTKQAALPE